MKPARSPETPLLPLGDAREAALFFVVAALCFLAVLAALSARATYGAAAGWTAEVAGELTVTLSGVDRRAAATAEALIAGTPGVTSAHLLTAAEINALLAPNFGSRGLPESLPVPHLIAVTADPAIADMGRQISGALTRAGFSAAVDTHTDWAGDVRKMLVAVRVSTLAIVVLLTFTALAVIAFATHAALLARREIVDVLHLSGARDRFIASLFERRFWVLGLRAGTVGALVALGGVILAMLAARAGSGRTGLLPELSLDFADALILVLAPIIAGLAARVAARLTVLGALKKLV
jgi:cell division transport system permease protein